MPEKESSPVGKFDKGKTKAQDQKPDNLLQRIKDSTKALASNVNNINLPPSNSIINSLRQFSNSKQSPEGSSLNDSTRRLYELEQKDSSGNCEERRTHFQVNEAPSIERNERVFETWRSEENDGTEILGFLEQQLPSDLVPAQLPKRELSQKWINEFEQASREVGNSWHTPEEDGTDVLDFLYSQEFPSNLVPDSIEDRSDIHEKWYQEFERLNFEVDTEQDASYEDVPLLEQTLDDWEREFNIDTHCDSDAFRDGPAKEYETLSSSTESSFLPYTPTHDASYHDPRMDGQEVLEFLNSASYSDETCLDFSDPTNLTSQRQSKYQPLSKSTGRKYASDILEYLVCVPYTDEVYGSYDFSWVDTRSDVLTESGQESVPNQYESALQRLKLLKAHLIPKV